LSPHPLFMACGGCGLLQYLCVCCGRWLMSMCTCAVYLNPLALHERHALLGLCVYPHPIVLPSGGCGVLEHGTGGS
jgi:hypothetical protein